MKSEVARLFVYQLNVSLFSSKFLVSKETVLLRRWERSKQKFGFINSFDKTKFLFSSAVFLTSNFIVLH